MTFLLISKAFCFLQRFFNGTDEYRNERLKFIPSVVDGPLAVRMLAPPKKEKVVQHSYLPVSWTKHPPKTVNGRKLCAALESELDCLSSRTIRGMAGIVKKHMASVSIDIGVTIGKPDGINEDEPQACLGLWRFDRIDVSSCLTMPDRFSIEAKEQGQSPDVIRASKIMNLSKEEIQEMAKSCMQ
jgi:hypothetical protein